MRSLRVFSLLAVLVAGTFLAGCGNDKSVTGVNSTPLPDPGTLVEDPLDGVLNSTDGSTPSDHGMLVGRLAEKLGLTDEQKAALMAAYQEFHDGLQALRQQVRSGDITLDEAKAAAAALRDAFEAELQVILTPEQYDLLQQMRQDRDGQGDGKRDPNQRWLAWLTKIGADESQISAVMDAIQTMNDALKAVHESLRNHEITGKEARDQVMQIRDDFDAALQGILTADQYQALQDLRPDQRGKHGPGHDDGGDDDNGGDDDGDDDGGMGGGPGGGPGNHH